MRTALSTLSCFLWLIATFTLSAKEADIIVSANGDGDYRTITEAIDALPKKDFQRLTILVKDGVYNERIRIEQDYITLSGESKDKTIIEYNQLKKDWDKNKDHIGAALVNIHADDIVIENITIKNTYPKIGPTAYAIYGTGTRTVIQNCNLIGNGANTVSLTDYKNGMYYLNNCRIEGTVDFMRAMGWCYMDNCSFFQKEAIASVWHAAITDKSQKMVIKNSHFNGTEHFFLGRHHYDAQFFLIDCDFTEKLADLPIYYKTYKKAPEKERPYIWGDRHYFFNCHREGGNYSWMNNNLATYSKKLKTDKITASWTFDEKWNPETSAPPVCTDINLNDGMLFLSFDQVVTTEGELVLETSSGKELTFSKGKGRSVLSFSYQTEITKADIKGGLKIVSGSMSNTVATTKKLTVSSPIKK